MGYNTYYRIQAVDASTHEPKSVEFLNFFTFYDTKGQLTPSYGHDESFCMFGGEPVAQWDHEREMHEISMNEKTTIFILDGEGEEQGDVWRMFFYNGVQRTWHQEMTVPPEVEEISWT